MNLVDSSGWLEYFSDGKNAKFFAAAIENGSRLIVSAINIYEVFRKVLSERGEAEARQAVSVMQQVTVVSVDAEISIDAAKLSQRLKIPMADAIILATARALDAVVWTQDADFKGLPGVRYVKKR